MAFLPWESRGVGSGTFYWLRVSHKAAQIEEEGTTWTPLLVYVCVCVGHCHFLI